MEDELTTAVNSIVKTGWDLRAGQVIPESEDITLGNSGVTLGATILYADLADSTELALCDPEIAAEVCKAYLVGTTRLIRAAGGAIRSFDGDRVMGVFMGNSKNTNAAKAALKINYFFTKILEPALLREGVVIRGSVTVGKAALSWGLLYGQGLIDAYDQERQAGPPRIIVDQSVIDEEKNNSRLWTDGVTSWELLGQLLARETIGDKEVLFIDYLWIARLTARQDVYEDFVTKHRQLIDENLAKNHASGVAKKYEWMDQYHNRSANLTNKTLLRF